MTLVAIHQPNFFPWLGYFDKLRRAEVFIVLDHVQFSKTGGTWSNRVRLCVGAEAKWMTAPIRRSYHGLMAVNNMHWDESRDWRRRILRTITNSYAKASFFDETMALIEPLLMNVDSNLATYNLRALRAIAQHLSLSTEKWFVSSELGAEAVSTEMLINLVRRVGGTQYLCGGGAAEYQRDEAFGASGIELVYQNFVHPTYTQNRDEFLPGLSIIDALVHLGAEGTRQLLGQEGRPR